MDKEIVYRRSRKDVLMYLVLCIMVDFGCIYAIQVNSIIIGIIGLVIFSILTIYLLFRLFVPNNILVINKEGIKTKYTNGNYILWEDISDIYMDMDSYKDVPVNVIAIKLRNEEESKKNIKFSKPKKNARGDYNINLKYSNGNIDEAIKEIQSFYKSYVK